MIRPVLYILLFLIGISCNPAVKPKKIAVATIGNAPEIHMVLPESLLHRKAEFESVIRNANKSLEEFAFKYGWDSLVREPFFDSVMIFDDKRAFDRTLLILAGADTTMKLPEAFCGALEKRTLTVMTPEYYARVYPEGVEARSYEKLLVHEMAHRLHIRILRGNEEAMGPIWFYEGFAVFAADQFAGRDVRLSDAERKEILLDPDRGSYQKYGTVFRYYAKKFPLAEMISKSGVIE